MQKFTSTHQCFVVLFLVLFGIGILFAATVNFIIDPFSLYHPSESESLHLVKVCVTKQMRLHKAVQIARKKPEVILLGSSRVAAGVDPNDVKNITKDRVVYNAGINGASLEEIYYFFEHALYHQPNLNTVIIGLDLFNFHHKKKPQPDFPVNYLKNSIWNFDLFLTCLFHKLTLTSSFETLWSNLFSFPSLPILPDGAYNLSWFNHHNTENYVSDDWSFLKMIFQNMDFYLDFQIDQEKIRLFQKIVEICNDRQITLKVFFCPSKAIYWHALYDQGLWPKLEELKHDLCFYHPIWDFSGFNTVTTQEYEKDQPFYYECSHFCPCIGKLILNRLFNLSASFGYLLTPETIEQSLQSIRQDHALWLKKHKDLAQKVEESLHENF